MCLQYWKKSFCKSAAEVKIHEVKNISKVHEVLVKYVKMLEN